MHAPVRRALLIVLAVEALLAAPARAQDPVQRVRELYAAAAYEDVLAAVSSAPAVSSEVNQYRVFALVALDRLADAESAAAAIVSADLRFHVDADASPRIREIFAAARRRVAPAALKDMYAAAKAAYDGRDRDAAIKGFGDLVAAAAEPDLADDTTIAEFRLLSAGFLELSRALPVPPPPAPATPPVTRAVTVPPFTPPTVITEVLPPWHPSEALARLEFRGSLRVRIDATGHVAGAELVRPVHPEYDALLLKAARDWVYQPARRDGVAVPADRIVEVVLKPRR